VGGFAQVPRSWPTGEGPDFRMIDLKKVDPKEILNASWHEKYHAMQKNLHDELVKLNACILVLGKIHSFPFRIFAPYGERSHFWDITSVCLFESAVLSISKLLDSGENTETLRHFKNEILKNLRDEEVREQVKAALRASNFEPKLVPLEGKIRELRNNIVAHLNRTWVNADAEFRKARAVGLTELRNTAQVLEDLFAFLCFDLELPPQLIDYWLSRHSSGGADIDELLDDVVRKSWVFNCPEKEPEAWQELKATMPTPDVEVINSYRKKFKLEPI
jgi:hypothetical protein